MQEHWRNGKERRLLESLTDRPLNPRLSVDVVVNLSEHQPKGIRMAIDKLVKTVRNIQLAANTGRRLVTSFEPFRFVSAKNPEKANSDQFTYPKCIGLVSFLSSESFHLSQHHSKSRNPFSSFTLIPPRELRIRLQT